MISLCCTKKVRLFFCKLVIFFIAFTIFDVLRSLGGRDSLIVFFLDFLLLIYLLSILLAVNIFVSFVLRTYKAKDFRKIWLVLVSALVFFLMSFQLVSYWRSLQFKEVIQFVVSVLEGEDSLKSYVASGSSEINQNGPLKLFILGENYVDRRFDFIVVSDNKKYFLLTLSYHKNVPNIHIYTENISGYELHMGHLRLVKVISRLKN